MGDTKHDPNTATISSHVLDTSLGTPGKGLKMALFVREGNGNFSEISRHETNEDGRVKDFKPIAAGVYKLVFETDEYYLKQNIECFYPECSIVFRTKLGEHYHVPLLISPFGYTTYRGS
eukprot:CAMPEP_0114509846 /NCGR_PEP_ID=MMETSP0109-20121206/13444_1 /TAXON_ID=29199 /ORGANISM="Chlorarachnion reptans, Strain CCCM449" /LENGTH=118 /DNA_ID=CAMNT_0001689059 /DNA_START=121 /DNA_END=477 /DNA_ORIENTATION=-